MGLKARDYFLSNVDPCVFYRHDSIILTYVDDCIIVAKDLKTIDDLVNSLKNGPENY